MDESALLARVARARSGDAEAQGELFEAFRSDVTRLCRRLLASREDAEDAVQETFWRLRQGVTSYDPSRPFRRWLLALAAHQAIDRLRRHRREQRLFDGEEHASLQADGGELPLAGELRAERRRQVLAAIDALPDRYRAPLVLRYYADLDYAAIGEVLGVDANQVATLLHRGRRRLRAALAPPGEHT